MLLQRLLLHKDKGDPIAYVVIFQGLVAVLTGIYAFANGFQAPDVSRYWLPISATCILYGLGHVMYARTLRQVETSVFAILFATYALWVMLMGIMVFGSSIGLGQVLGTGLIFISITLLIERKAAFKIDRGILLGLITGAIFGFATVAWIYVGRHTPDIASWTALSFAGPALVVLASSPKSVSKMKLFMHGDMFIRIVLLGIIYSISGLTQLLAFSRGPVSLVAPLLQTSIIVTTVLAIIFLRETTRLIYKALAAIICFLGVLLIVR